METDTLEPSRRNQAISLPGRPKPFLGTDMNSHGSRWEPDIICSVTETWRKLGKLG